jgi:uncharacterized protein (TIGR03663 family)
VPFVRNASKTSELTPPAVVDFPSLQERMRHLQRRAAEIDWTPWLIIAFGALLRVLLLGMKPPHFDEGINGWFVDQMVKNGFYKYDPSNYHGPLHFYVLFLFKVLFGRNIWALRMPVVLVSVGCIYLTLKFEALLGRNVTRLAALAMAVSPGFVFYGRYSIHEVWLVLFSMMFILGLLGLWKFGRPNYLWCAGMGLTGMVLTKETYILHLVCALLAIPAAWLSFKLIPAENINIAKQRWTASDLITVIAVGIALIVFFYSGVFFNWAGVKGVYETFKIWFQTGKNGNGHEKPWFYWMLLIARYELPVLIGLCFCLRASGLRKLLAFWLAGLTIAIQASVWILVKQGSLQLETNSQMFWLPAGIGGGALICLGAAEIRNGVLRALAIYAIGTLTLYSLVPYKTPWCIITIVWPFLFFFGAAVLSIPNKYRTIRSAIAMAALCVSLGSSIWLNYFRYTNDNEPYVYVQTNKDIYRLTVPLLTLAHRNPSYYQVVGHMIRTSAYPFPWILGDFPRIGYYEHDNLPDKVDADFLLVQEDRVAAIEKLLHESYYTMPLTIRAFQDTSKLYLNAKTFAPFFPNRSPDFHPGK